MTHDLQTGAIKQCIAYCFGKMWAHRGSDYQPERVDAAATAELTVLLAKLRELEAEKANHWRSGAAEGGKDG
jgi:hypothetical protein